MKNKALIVTTTPYMIIQFLMNDIEILQNLGYQVEVATNCSGFNVLDEKSLNSFLDKLKSMDIKINQIDFTRNIFNLKIMIRSYKEMRKLMNDRHYELMHTHTPIASAISRFVARRKHTYTLYTAHGFHFYKGASLINWLMYYPIEKICSKWTDVLITINKEDYNFAKTKLKSKRVYYVPGIGIDLKRDKSLFFNRKEYRKKLGLNENDFAILSVGELNKNKNHISVIKCMPQLDQRIHYFIAGQGNLENNLKLKCREYGIEDRVHFLGFRNDIAQLNMSSDLYILPSLREGLNVSLMEAMSTSLPCIANRIRGNVDLITNGEGGFLVDINNQKELIDKIKYMYSNNCKKMGENNKKKIEGFSVESVSMKMSFIYKNLSLREE